MESNLVIILCVLLFLAIVYAVFEPDKINIIKSLRKHWKSPPAMISYAFFIYIVFTIVVFLNKDFLEPLLWEGFYTSFLASSTEDVLFFGVVGIVLAIISIRDHAKDKLHLRINNLFSFDDNLPAKVKDNITMKMRKLAVYSPSVSQNLHVIEYNKKYDAIKILIIQKVDLKNMLHDTDYAEYRKINIAADEIDKDETDIYGRVTNVLFQATGRKSKTIAENISMYQPKVSYNILEEIPAGGTAIASAQMWVWHKSGEEFTFTSHHTSASTVLTISNGLGKDETTKIKVELNGSELGSKKFNGDVESESSDTNKVTLESTMNITDKDGVFLEQLGKISFKLYAE